MATPKTQEQIGTDNGTMDGAAPRTFNGGTNVAPLLPTLGSPGWWAAIKALEHYDPAYPYGPAYVYDDDHTTDPDYGVDGITYVTTEIHKFSMASLQVNRKRAEGTLCTAARISGVPDGCGPTGLGGRATGSAT